MKQRILDTVLSLLFAWAAFMGFGGFLAGIWWGLEMIRR